MADSYPSVGLRIDLNEIVEGQARLSGLKQTMLDTGRAAADLAHNIDNATRGLRQRAASATQANSEVSRSTRRAAEEETRTAREIEAAHQRNFRLRSRLAAENLATQTRAAQDTARTDRRLADDVLNFRIRMWRQMSAESERSARAQRRAQEEADAESIRSAQRVLEFRMRMNRQMTAELANQARYAALGPWGGIGPSGRPMAGGGAGGGGIAEALGLRAAFDALSSASARMMGALSGVRRVLGDVRSAVFDARTAVAVFLGAMVLGPVFHMADAMTALEARTAFYAKTASDVPYTFQAIYRTAQEARTPLAALATLYTRLAPMAERLGKSQGDILRTAGVISKSFAIGGATRAEATSSSQQLAQALASNRLGGDELRSLGENAAILVAKIAEALNMNVGEFIKWAHAGKANAAIIIGAIDKAAQSINEMFARFPVTISQATTLVGNAFTHLVGEVNKATGASTAIASMIAQFARLLESEKTINLVTGAVNGLGTALGFMGDAVRAVGNYFPVLLAALAAMTAAKVLPPIFAAWRTQMLAAGLAAGYMGKQSTLLFAAQGMLGTGLEKTKAGLGGLISMLGGPWGVAVIAATGVLMAFVNANKAAAASGEAVVNSNSNIAAALDRSTAFANTYGDSTKDLRTKLLDLVSANTSADTAARMAAAGNDEAARMAIYRAEAEKEATARIWDRIAADDAAEARKARNSVNGIFGLRTQRGVLRWLGTNTGEMPSLTGEDPRPSTPGMDARINDALSNAERLERNSRMAAEAAAAVRASRPTVTKPGPGSGVVQGSSNKDDKDSEAKALQRRIDQLKEETYKSEAATRAIMAEMATRQKLADTLTAYYQDVNAGAGVYAAAMRAQADAELAAAIAQERSKILADQKVKSLDALTGEIRTHTEALITQRTAELTAADSARRLDQALTASTALEAEISDMNRYTVALRNGRDALMAYTRQKMIDDEVARAGPNADVEKITGQVDRKIRAQALQDEADRNRLREEGRRLASMSSREAQIEAEALARADEYLKSGAASTRVMAENLARGTIELEKWQDRLDQLRRETKDSIRQAFIESGRLDLRSLKENVGRAIREAIYDKLIAQPISIIVDAVVNVVANGIDELIKKFMNANGGNNPFAQFGKGAKEAIDKIGDTIGNWVNKLPASVGKAINVGSQIYASAQIGSSVSNMLGFEGHSNTRAQNIANLIGAGIGYAIAGPIGAAIGSFITNTVGSLIEGGSKGERPYSATRIRVENGRFVVGENFTERKSGGPTDAVNKLATQLARGLNATAKAFGVDMAKLANYYTMVGHVSTDGKAKLYGAAAAGFFGGQPTSPQGAQTLEQLYSAHIERGIDVYGIEDPAEVAKLIMKDFLNDAVRAGALNLNEAELALINAAENLDEAAETIKKLRGLKGTLELELLKYTDPRAYALQTLQNAQVERRRTVNSYYDEGLIERGSLDAVLASLETEELRAQLSELADAAGGAVASLERMREAQQRIADFAAGMLTGNLSPLSPEAKLNIEGSNFWSMLTRAQGGDYRALSGVTDSAQTYLEAAQDFFGSTGSYAEIFQRVHDALDALATQEFEDPLAAEIQQASLDLQAAIAAGSQAIVNAITTTVPATPTTPPPANDNPGDVPGSPGWVSSGNVVRDALDAARRAAEAQAIETRHGLGNIAGAVVEESRFRTMLKGG